MLGYIEFTMEEAIESAIDDMETESLKRRHSVSPESVDEIRREESRQAAAMRPVKPHKQRETRLKF